MPSSHKEQQKLFPKREYSVHKISHPFRGGICYSCQYV